MSPQTDSIRLHLFRGPLTAKQLSEKLNVSQPTISRTLALIDDQVIRVVSGQSIQYTLRDTSRGLSDISIYRVSAQGQIKKLGTLVPVRPEGFVMIQEDSVTLHSDGLPWWLFDMRPQGYLGRAYASRHGAEMGLPERVNEWTDTQAIRALLAHGHDVIGNLLLGDLAREQFLNTPEPEPILDEHKLETYAELALEAARGDRPGSSAAGEQPKFTAYAVTPDGPQHVIVKFSELEEGPVSERWRDLLLSEHLALLTLQEAGIPASRTQLYDHGGQRFLEIVRFDRTGNLGRHALFSLAALDAEFVGRGTSGWPVIAQHLVNDGHIHQHASDTAALLWAFGTLIGNTDMHNGNLSFASEHGRPYDIAPAYDMTPMAFAPRTGGGLPDTIPEANIHASVSDETWRRSEELARAFLVKVVGATGFSARFSSCIVALNRHIEIASAKIQRLG